jgi:hypothetical protein
MQFERWTWWMIHVPTLHSVKLCKTIVWPVEFVQESGGMLHFDVLCQRTPESMM